MARCRTYECIVRHEREVIKHNEISSVRVCMYVACAFFLPGDIPTRYKKYPSVSTKKINISSPFFDSSPGSVLAQEEQFSRRRYDRDETVQYTNLSQLWCSFGVKQGYLISTVEVLDADSSPATTTFLSTDLKSSLLFSFARTTSRSGKTFFVLMIHSL